MKSVLKRFRKSGSKTVVEYVPVEADPRGAPPDASSCDVSPDSWGPPPEPAPHSPQAAAAAAVAHQHHQQQPAPFADWQQCHQQQQQHHHAVVAHVSDSPSQNVVPKTAVGQAQQQQQQQAPQAAAPESASAYARNDSVTICVCKHCPAALKRDRWNVTEFELRKLMYNGAISMVYHAVDRRSGITVALKLYKRAKLNEIERHQVAREIKLHSELCHESIIALHSAWKDRSYVYMCIEWAPGGDVYTYLRSRPGLLGEELAVALILQPFMAGLAVMHEQGLIHRDIKPENILINNSFQVKIADFGLSIDSKHEIANTRLGTIDYLAPEILDCPVKHHPPDFKDDPTIGYSNKVDCWSVGILAYELLTGAAPYAAPTPQETLRMIRSKRIEYPLHLSPGAVAFMQRALVRDPDKRDSILQLLEHPWILKHSRRGTAQPAERRMPRRPTVDNSHLSRQNTGGTADADADDAESAAAGASPSPYTSAPSPKGPPPAPLPKIQIPASSAAAGSSATAISPSSVADSPAKAPLAPWMNGGGAAGTSSGGAGTSAAGGGGGGGAAHTYTVALPGPSGSPGTTAPSGSAATHGSTTFKKPSFTRSFKFWSTPAAVPAPVPTAVSSGTVPAEAAGGAQPSRRNLLLLPKVSRGSGK